MRDSLVVSRYARALLELAQEQGELESVATSLSEVRKAVDKHPEISHLVLNSTIAKAEKEDFIDKVFPTDTSKLVVQFLKVLIKKHRFKEIGEIESEFNKLYLKIKGIQKVTAITAVALSDKNVTKLKDALKSTLQCDIELIQEINEDLLGGLVLQFDGKEVNGSFKNRLDEIKQILQA